LDFESSVHFGVLMLIDSLAISSASYHIPHFVNRSVSLSLKLCTMFMIDTFDGCFSDLVSSMFRHQFVTFGDNIPLALDLSSLAFRFSTATSMATEWVKSGSSGGKGSNSNDVFHYIIF
jgi:hypothetical protein